MYPKKNNLLSKIIILIIINLMTNLCCIATQDTNNYSDILKDAIKTMARPSITGTRAVPGLERIKGINTPDAVPYLIDVLLNGPDWKEEKGVSPNIARCSAARILGQIRDKRAVEPLIEVLKVLSIQYRV